MRSSPCPSTALRQRCEPARRHYRRWAAAWTPTLPISSPPRRPAGTPAACCARLARLESVEDVDHEHQRVGALDARLRLPGTSVTVSRRNGAQHAAAHGLALQALVPARSE